ncbi:MAG: UDP-N-acetylglucosamine 2-epimerase [Muribaculaceae bacterium]|nr:UDP-N-acetylglucosamine 2-epimerase [Bacteroidales bacterium]MDY4811858.1 UDP-N-acetylglucosamine 2-epimerase [Muribaculaceae bacterium]
MATANHKRKICIVTSTRADWGLLSGVAKALNDSESVELQIIATNMHLDPRFGMTVNEILDDGFTVNERVEMPAASDSPADTAVATAKCLEGMARAFQRLKPDILVILGDRYEMLAVATAATIMRIPIAHISGGEISEGAFDDSIRHALTKLSTLHFTATNAYRNRVISMGEDPANVFYTGALGVYNIINEPVLTKAELDSFVGIDINPSALLVTFHPATLDPVPVKERIGALLEALDWFKTSNVIFTYPNNDPQGEVIIREINDYAQKNPHRVAVVPSLGRTRYISMLHYVAAVVGNSSSGIVEVPSMHIPTVDIGIRQKGRIAAPSVIHCDSATEAIHAAISFALSPAAKRIALFSSNPYARPDTVKLITDRLIETDLSRIATKRFVDPYPILDIPMTADNTIDPAELQAD